MTIRISVRDEYAPRFGRQTLTLWSGAYASDFEGDAMELPRHDGFMLTIGGRKIRVTCDAPRTEDNFAQVDAAINATLGKAHP